MHLVLRRSGGIAGIPRPPLVVDTQDLPPAAAEHIHALARAVASEVGHQWAVPAANANARDTVGYSLSITDHVGKETSVSFAYPSATDTLKVLVAALLTASSKP